MAHKSKEIMKQLGRFFNYKLSFDKNYASAKFVLPGFNYSHIDRSGQVNMFAINRILETSRIAPLDEGYFPTDPTGNSALVVLAHHFNVSQALYEKARMVLPMISEHKIVALGQTSIICELTLTEENTGIHLATILRKLVNMDLKARKSCNIYPKIRETYENVVKMTTKEAFDDILPPEVPNNVFNSTRTVRHSDMDFMFHTNQAMYMKYFLDAICEGVNQDHFTKITSDICWYRAHRAKSLHFAETGAGDLLGIHVWEDGDNPHHIHCVISNFSKGINNASMVYYGGMEFTTASS